MSIKSFVSGQVTRFVTSQARLLRARARAERTRIAQNAPHRVLYFHDAGDPYSHLTSQVLTRLSARYAVELEPHLVGPPPDWAAPDRERLDAYSRRDAAVLARAAGLSFDDPGCSPRPDALRDAERALTAAIVSGTFFEAAPRIGARIWTGEGRDLGDAPALADESARLKQAGDALRAKLGHYLGATFYYGGEWYWGIDRLHQLEARLTALGLRRSSKEDGEGAAETVAFFVPPDVPSKPRPAQPPSSLTASGSAPPVLDFFLSFRSPYTYIAFSRATALADAYGAELRLRYVLPMVMRGLAVPKEKRGYIVSDVAREARRLGIPFGTICDPVGRPVERGYSLFPLAISQGRGRDYALSFLQGVWAEGLDAGSQTGLRRIAERAGLNWKEARSHLGSEAWRPIAEANRKDMTQLGLWGVPCFRVGAVSAWGQDRLFVIENALKSHDQRIEEDRQ